ncbi:tape measure protein [Prevotella denticola]|uniref:tape measure protein n=1 Tax=Prevotella denticola TaxID=28129 RepID=UPI001BC83821|nr:tape measure protein [Prevotella denticola]QUI93630.1 tape measure protein [Prevotella denticola]
MDSVLKFLIKLQADGGNVLTVARQTSTQLDDISRKARTTGTRLREAFSFSTLKSSLMSIPGMELLTNPYALAAGAIGAITKIGAEAEQTAVAFTTLVGSESKAKGMLSEIAKFAAESPFGKLDLTENAKTMLNFGVETGKVLPLLKQLGDISGGNKQALQSLSLVLGQVSAAGKLAGQDNLQFINAGFNPLQELAKMTGESYAKLQDRMSKGQITFENVVQAIQHATGEGGKFFSMMDKQSQTVAGKWSTILDNVQTSAVNMFSQVQSPIGDFLDLINDALPHITAIIESLFSHLVAGIQFIIQYRTEFAILAGVIGTVWAISKAYSAALLVYQGVMTAVTTATKIWTGVQWLLNAAMDANPIGLIIIGIAALVAAVVYCWNKFVGFRAFILTMWDTLKGFGNIIKDYIINRFNEMLAGLGKLGEALKKLFSGDFQGAAASAMKGFKKLSGVESTAKAINGTKQLVSGVGGNFQTHLRQEQQKDKKTSSAKKENKISTPGLSGSTGAVVFGEGESKGKKGKKGKKGGKKGGRKSAEELATGGTRNTSITMHIGKFFDNINVYMNDKTDTAELERTILQSMNRALAIAASTDR